MGEETLGKEQSDTVYLVIPIDEGRNPAGGTEKRTLCCTASYCAALHSAVPCTSALHILFESCVFQERYIYLNNGFKS